MTDMKRNIEKDTPLLPEVVADSVLGEASRFLGKDLPDEWVVLLADKCEGCYNAKNPQFKRKMKGANGREWLYSFMRHWLTGLLFKYDRPSYEKVSRTEFPIGRELPTTHARWNP